MTALSLDDPQQFVEARLQLHYAVQCIAAVGAALADPVADYSHTSMSWEPVGAQAGLVGGVVPVAYPFRVGLDLMTLTLVLLNPTLDLIATSKLESRTLNQALDWLKAEIKPRGAAVETIQLLQHPDDFPHHSLAEGDSFKAPQTLPMEAVWAYLSHTHAVLQSIKASLPQASPIRIWPHHFDMAFTWDRLDPVTQVTQSIGVGLSPGDQIISKPYWYVTIWPYPEPNALPELPKVGYWHTEGWTGAVLQATTLLASEQPSSDTVARFLSAAIHPFRP